MRGIDNGQLRVWLTIGISPQKDIALHRLKVFKGLKKVEVMDLGLDLVLQYSPEEIASMVEAKRNKG